MIATIPQINYCKKCLLPSSSAIPVAFDDHGVCSACRTSKEKEAIDWDRRLKKFQRILEQYRSKDGSNYDCIIPVSGGKDSFFQVHQVKNEMGFNPLLVTYNSNNYTPTGLKNLQRMRDVFGCDHVFFTTSVHTLQKLNRISVQIMGDTQWHYQSGIFTYPFQVAVQMNIPLLIWGEHGHMDIGGMHSYNDFVEFTYRYRHEHILRGFEWTDFMAKAAEYGETLERREMIPFVYPSDEEIDRVGVRGIYMANFVKWEANEHGPLMMEKYGWLENEEPFERTYRRMSNLDDFYENGIHDYLKFIKFGYGRATDHACKDIRAGKMTREEGIKIIQQMDHVKSKDVYQWLDFVGWTEEQFDHLADTYRDPRVWWIRDGQWHKMDITGEPTAYGKVHLTPEEQQKYVRA
ncbi:N-acetyl sugar amidotransferase [bacterium SCSIO 12741]|nr:N-acetyl sugar amidotransferase [bacterium SCSIO 12741]